MLVHQPTEIASPVIDVRTVAATLDVDKRTAQGGIERLTEAEVLREITGYRRNRVWAADELFDVLDGDQPPTGQVGWLARGWARS